MTAYDAFRYFYYNMPLSESQEPVQFTQLPVPVPVFAKAMASSSV
jgi:hypothetical protein